MALCTSFVAALALTACGGDDRPPPPAPGDGGPRDGGTDGAALDALAGDGAVPDAGVPEFCTLLTAEPHKLGTDNEIRDRVVGVAPGAGAFAVTWSARPAAMEDVFVARVPADGTAPPVAIDVTSDTAISRDPDVVAVGSAWLLAWFDNATAGFDIQAQPLDPATGGLTGTRSEISTSALRDDSPALAVLGSGSVLATWVEDDLTAGTRTAIARILAASGAPTGSVVRITMPPVAPPSIVAFALGDGAGVAWTQDGASGADIVIQALDAAAALRGSAQTLTTEHNVAGAFDIAGNATGAALVFTARVGGARDEVRFRKLDASGAPAGTERIITLAPEVGRDPSIAPFAGGYIVSYRAMPGGGLTEPTVRVARVTLDGTVVGRQDVSVVTDQGGRTTVRVTAAGEVLVAWPDSGDLETEILAMPLSCTG